MIATELDSVWFHGNPDRRFRLRQLTSVEMRQWAIPSEPGFTAWCIVRCEDGAIRLFALPNGVSWNEDDDEIASFFGQLEEVT
ncbi:hypothetical protein [Methylobacterium thuringiense]|uniref:hypothetical protein n=1 Tax=Methylobacterium thuringiense TaxID=1003091 RepID=UPI001EDD80D9|nr:hypothetical protein [Methylobacterium thuringiense]